MTGDASPGRWTGRTTFPAEITISPVRAGDRHSAVVIRDATGALALALAAIPILVTYGQPPASDSDTHIQVSTAHPPAPAEPIHTGRHGDQE